MILITGATGNIGTELVKQLAAQGVPQRVVSRDKAKVSGLDQQVDRIIGDLRDRSTVQLAVSGIERVFMIWLIYDESQAADRMLIEEAQRAGVQHIVKISSLSVHLAEGSTIGRMHREKEQVIEKSGMAWTFLRPGSFMSNALQWLPTIKAQGTVFNPMGEGKYAPIAPRDIARVAALALTTSGHQGKAYDLTGPELLSTPEQVQILSTVLGKPIECVDIPVGVASERLQKLGVSALLANGLISLWSRIKEGNGAFQNGEVEKLTGLPAQTFEDWAWEHRSHFELSPV